MNQAVSAPGPAAATQPRPGAFVVSAVFPPEATYTAATSHDLAAGLAAAGFDVTVLAPFPSHPAGRLFPGYRRALYRAQARDAYRLVHCFSFLSPRSTLWSRFLENVSFGLTSALYLLFAPRPALVYANSWPIFAASMLAAVAALRRVPLVTSVQDIYPESLYSQGRMGPRNPLARLMRRIDRWVARRSALLFVIARNFEELYTSDRGIPPARVKLVRNWGAAPEPAPPAAALDFRRSHGIPAEARLAAYGGNIGMASGVETIIDAFTRLAAEPDVYLLIAGVGSNLECCRELARGSERILFHSPWPKEETAAVLAAGDLLLLPTRGAQSLASAPSKLISYMFAGRPVLALALPGAEIARIIEEAGCGWVIPPDDPQAAARALRECFNASPERLRAMGEAGRRFALEHLARERAVPRVVELIRGVARSEALPAVAQASAAEGHGLGRS